MFSLEFIQPTILLNKGVMKVCLSLRWPITVQQFSFRLEPETRK